MTSEPTPERRVRRVHKRKRRTPSPATAPSPPPEESWGDSPPRTTWRTRSSHLLAWIGGLALLGLALLLITSFFRQKPTPTTHSTPHPAPSGPQRIPLKKGSLLDTATRFLSARQPADFRGLIRHESNVLPRIEAHLRHFPDENRNWQLEGIEKEVVRQGPFTILRLRGRHLPGRRLILEKENDTWLVDWESFVVDQEVPWSHLAHPNAPARARLRVSAQKAPPNSPAPFLLRDPLRQQQLLAHPAPDLEKNPLGKKFLTHPQGAWVLQVSPTRPGEVTIQSVLSPGWVTP